MGRLHIWHTIMAKQALERSRYCLRFADTRVQVQGESALHHHVKQCHPEYRLPLAVCLFAYNRSTSGCPVSEVKVGCSRLPHLHALAG